MSITSGVSSKLLSKNGFSSFLGEALDIIEELLLCGFLTLILIALI